MQITNKIIKDFLNLTDLKEFFYANEATEYTHKITLHPVLYYFYLIGSISTIEGRTEAWSKVRDYYFKKIYDGIYNSPITRLMSDCFITTYKVFYLKIGTLKYYSTYDNLPKEGRILEEKHLLYFNETLLKTLVVGNNTPSNFLERQNIKFTFIQDDEIEQYSYIELNFKSIEEAEDFIEKTNIKDNWDALVKNYFEQKSYYGSGCEQIETTNHDSNKQQPLTKIWKDFNNSLLSELNN